MKRLVKPYSVRWEFSTSENEKSEVSNINRKYLFCIFAYKCLQENQQVSRTSIHNEDIYHCL